MTYAELERAMLAKRKLLKLEMQQRASYDYILADLIGSSIARLYSSSATMPEISAAYPTVFDNKEYEEARQEKQDELSALRFKLFAESFNKKFEEVAKDNNE